MNAAPAEPAWTLVLSGPESTRAKAEVALENGGFYPLPDDHHAPMDWVAKLTPLASGKKPKTKHGFITVQADDINTPTGLLDKHGWVLRAHYPTPDPPAPPATSLAVTVAELRAELDALKSRVP